MKTRNHPFEFRWKFIKKKKKKASGNCLSWSQNSKYLLLLFLQLIVMPGQRTGGSLQNSPQCYSTGSSSCFPLLYSTQAPLTFVNEASPFPPFSPKPNGHTHTHDPPRRGFRLFPSYVFYRETLSSSCRNSSESLDGTSIHFFNGRVFPFGVGISYSIQLFPCKRHSFCFQLFPTNSLTGNTFYVFP